jgi:hypothetical protein
LAGVSAESAKGSVEDFTEDLKGGSGESPAGSSF